MGQFAQQGSPSPFNGIGGIMPNQPMSGAPGSDSNLMPDTTGGGPLPSGTGVTDNQTPSMDITQGPGVDTGIYSNLDANDACVQKAQAIINDNSLSYKQKYIKINAIKTSDVNQKIEMFNQLAQTNKKEPALITITPGADTSKKGSVNLMVFKSNGEKNAFIKANQPQDNPSDVRQVLQQKRQAAKKRNNV